MPIVQALRLKLDNVAIEHFFDVTVSSEQIGYAKEDIHFGKSSKNYTLSTQKQPFY